MRLPGINLKLFLEDENGASAVEYGVLIALIIAAVIAVIITIGGRLQQGFQSFTDELVRLGVST